MFDILMCATRYSFRFSKWITRKSGKGFYSKYTMMMNIVEQQHCGCACGTYCQIICFLICSFELKKKLFQLIQANNDVENESVSDTSYVPMRTKDASDLYENEDANGSSNEVTVQ